jgi:hypothetical protein
MAWCGLVLPNSNRGLRFWLVHDPLSGSNLVQTMNRRICFQGIALATMTMASLLASLLNNALVFAAVLRLRTV